MKIIFYQIESNIILSINEIYNVASIIAIPQNNWRDDSPWPTMTHQTAQTKQKQRTPNQTKPSM